MSPSRASCFALLATCLAVASVSAANAPPIGVGARFNTKELGPGWHRGFFNQTRTVPPCYLLIIFETRSSPDEALRIKQTIPIARVQRLQVTAAPGTSMQEWKGLALPAVPENSWREIDLAPLRAAKGQCEFEEPLGS
jgi:hypothetical protein